MFVLRANTPVVATVGNSDVKVRYHSLSREAGYAYVVVESTGKFEQVKLENIRVVKHA